MDLYQICSNYTPGAKNGTTQGHMLYIGLYREMHEKSYVWNHKAYSLDIWYESLSSGLIPIFLKLYPWGQTLPQPGGHMLYILGLNREEHEKNFLS